MKLKKSAHTVYRAQYHIDWITHTERFWKMVNKPLITIGFSSHRIEVISFARRLMKNHDVIIIEEAPNPRFMNMLNRKVSINEYLSEENLEFPEFSRHMYELLREFYLMGKKILQIEPYMEQLTYIYNMFSEGEEPLDVLKMPEMREVYEAERKATGALLHFYESSMGNSFPKVIEAVKKFARADAERFRLRDKMRAEAIAEILPKDKLVYVEAGAVHTYLKKALRQILGKRWQIKSEFLLEPVVKKLTGEKQVIAPGDLLTAHYILCRRDNEEFETLQAARALIYIQILEKEEMTPSRAEKTPHIKDEIRAIEIANKFTLAQCEELYRKIRFRDLHQALEIVQNYISSSSSH
ncbi:MAG: hypothetical protein QMC83_07815 [Thermodesulfovibrionales bacterium]|nr:hypothetical protein [Thermodesulfovibrionales bacterium]